MTKISEEQVRHIAKLARLELKDEEAHKFSDQLSSVFEYMEILQEVDTEGVPETSQVTGLENVSEVDQEVSYNVDPEKLLECSELPVEADQILVQAAIKKN
jgi:aspartyl-tRNA(Asn)/glutamyl-tRNA(Gln) amidotransferase subunit C